MSLESAPYYWLKCDGCGVTSTEGSEFSAWKDDSTAFDSAVDSEWNFNANRTVHHCFNCPPLSCGECDRDFETEGPRKRDDDEISMCVECAA